MSADEVIAHRDPARGLGGGDRRVARRWRSTSTLTPELRRAGLAREVVRLVQEARKTAGLEVTDRVALRWSAEGELAEALREHASSVAGEVLATGFEEGLEGAAPTHTDQGLGLSFTLTRSAQ